MKQESTVTCYLNQCSRVLRTPDLAQVINSFQREPSLINHVCPSTCAEVGIQVSYLLSERPTTDLHP